MLRLVTGVKHTQISPWLTENPKHPSPLFINVSINWPFWLNQTHKTVFTCSNNGVFFFLFTCVSCFDSESIVWTCSNCFDDYGYDMDEYQIKWVKHLIIINFITIHHHLKIALDGISSCEYYCFLFWSQTFWKKKLS